MVREFHIHFLIVSFVSAEVTKLWERLLPWQRAPSSAHITVNPASTAHSQGSAYRCTQSTVWVSCPSLVLKTHWQLTLFQGVLFFPNQEAA